MKRILLFTFLLAFFTNKGFAQCASSLTSATGASTFVCSGDAFTINLAGDVAGAGETFVVGFVSIDGATTIASYTDLAGGGFASFNDAWLAAAPPWGDNALYTYDAAAHTLSGTVPANTTGADITITYYVGAQYTPIDFTTTPGCTFYPVTVTVGAAGVGPCAPPPPPPANDNVCSAIALTVDGATGCGNTSTATVEGTDISAGACSTPNNTVWYTFTPTVTGPHAITWAADAGTGFQAWVEVFTVTGCPTTPVLTNVADCATLGAVDPTTTTTSASFNATAGVTYYVMVDGFSGANGDYCIGVVSVPVIDCASANGGSVSLAPGAGSTVYCTTVPGDSIWLTLSGQVFPNVTPGATGSTVVLSTVPYTDATVLNADITAASTNLVGVYSGLADGSYFLLGSAVPLAAGTYYFTNYVYGDTLADGMPDPACAALSSSVSFTVVDCASTCLSTWTSVAVTGGCPGEDLVFNITGLTLDATQSLVLAVMFDGTNFTDLAGTGYTDFADAYNATTVPYAVAFDDMGISYTVDAAAGTVTIPGGLSATQCAGFDLPIYLAIVDGAPLDYTASVDCNDFEYIYTVKPSQPDFVETAGDCTTGATLTIGYDTSSVADGILDIICDVQTSAIPAPTCGTGDATEVVAGYTAADLSTFLTGAATCASSYTDIVPTLNAACANNAIPAATTVTIVDNDCAAGTPGTITAAPCGAGTHLEYTTDGTTWSTTAPAYDAVNPMTVGVKCVDDVTACESAPVAGTTAPIVCPTCVADAGTTVEDAASVCEGTAISATVSGTILGATDQILYFLTDATGTILQTSTTSASFTAGPGTYTIGTFVGLTSDIAICAPTLIGTNALTLGTCLTTNGACFDVSNSGVITVNANSTATVANGAICQDVTTTLDVATLVTAGDMAGTWTVTSDGGTGATLAGTTLTSGTAGTVTLSYVTTGACPTTYTVTVGVVADCTACSPDNGSWD